MALNKHGKLGLFLSSFYTWATCSWMGLNNLRGVTPLAGGENWILFQVACLLAFRARVSWQLIETKINNTDQDHGLCQDNLGSTIYSLILWTSGTWLIFRNFNHLRCKIGPFYPGWLPSIQQMESLLIPENYPCVLPPLPPQTNQRSSLIDSLFRGLNMSLSFYPLLVQGTILSFLGFFSPDWFPSFSTLPKHF